MSFKFSDVKTVVDEKGDGREFTDTQHARWANLIRKDVEANWAIAGFNYYYFLYKEATVIGGSVLNEGNYAQPDDFVTDLHVWYDNNILVKSPPGVIDIVQDLTGTGTPQWFKMAGQEFQLIPAPNEAGKEIKLIYGAMADEVPATSNDNFTDHFLKRFPNLHIFGMVQHAAESIGQVQLSGKYEQRYGRELSLLNMANRRHWISNARIRFQNWHEFEDKKTILFPQFRES